MPTTLLFTVFLLLSPSGQPASKAQLQCEEMLAYGSDDDEGVYAPVPADSRGAVVLSGDANFVFHCWAWKGDYKWSGTIQAEKDHQRFTVYLTKP